MKTFRTLALSFPGAEESPHFEKASFRANKRIFATLSENDQTVCIKLSPVDQSVFCSFDKMVIYPVPNTWGLQGWTMIDLKTVKKEMLIDAVSTSYNLALKKLTKL